MTSKIQQNIRWKRIQKIFTLEQDALKYYNKNYRGRGDIEDYEIEPTQFGNYKLWIKSNGMYDQRPKLILENG